MSVTVTRTVTFPFQRSTEAWQGRDMQQVTDLNSLWSESGVESVTKDLTRRNFRKLIANGQCASTDMSGSMSYSSESSPGFLRWEVQHYSPALETQNRRELIKGNFFSFGSVSSSPLSTTKATNRSLTSLYSNLSSVETAFKGMVFSGELRESLQMIRSPAKALRSGVGSYLDALRKRIPRRLSRRQKLKILSDTYLEYAFGWSPLVNDIDNAIKAFYKSKQVRPIFQMVRGFGIDSGTSNGGNFIVSPAGMHIRAFARTRTTTNAIVKHYGIYQSKGNGVSDSHSYGFRPTEFVPTLWELLPYSFVVDYFTNIGDIISSWSYRFIGLNFCTRTVVQERFVETFDERAEATTTTSGIGNVTWDGHPGTARARWKVFARSANVGLGVPSLELEVPGMSSLKWLNLAALATSLTTTRRHLNP